MLSRSRVPWAGVLVLVSLLVALSGASATVHSRGAIFAPALASGVSHYAWLLGVGASFCFYVVGVWWVSRRGSALLPVLVVAIVVQLAPLSGPLLLSSDSYAYWAYGRLAAIHHVNPYSVSPSRFPDDPATGGLLSPTTIYGPSFTALSEVHARLAGNSPARAEFLYRLGAALAVLGLLFLAVRCAPRPAFAAAFIGWNPLFALHFAGGGHNDIWMLVLAMGGVLASRREKPALAGALWAVSATVKASVLPLVPLEAVAAWRKLGSRTVLRFVFGFAVGALLAAGLATVLYGTAWPSSFQRASTQLRQTSSLSLVFQLTKVGLSTHTAKLLLGGLFVLGYAALLRDALRGRARLGLAAGLLIATPAWLVPWYGSWPVAFSAVEEDRAAQLFALVATAYLLADSLQMPF